MSEKKYELVFEHPSGLILTVLTDDIYGVSEQPWFRQFFEDAQLYVPAEQQEQEAQSTVQQVQQQQQQRPVQQQVRPVQRMQDPYGASVNPAMQRQQQQQVQEPPRLKSYLDVSAEAMNMDIWNQLTSQQREEWQRKWLK